MEDHSGYSSTTITGNFLISLLKCQWGFPSNFTQIKCLLYHFDICSPIEISRLTHTLLAHCHYAIKDGVNRAN